MTAVAGPRPTSLIRERTVRAIVLAPHRPLANWLVQLDRSAQQNQIAFDGKAALLDVSGLQPKQGELKALLARLHKRNIPIMAVEGTGLTSLGPGMPPLIKAGSPTSDAKPANVSDLPANVPAPRAAARVIEGAVRSGQSILFPEGDLTIVGSVSSGALRGRAVAGSTGNRQARVFCRELEAELLAIDGHYKTADDFAADLLGWPVQAWIEGG